MWDMSVVESFEWEQDVIQNLSSTARYMLHHHYHQYSNTCMLFCHRHSIPAAMLSTIRNDHTSQDRATRPMMLTKRNRDFPRWRRGVGLNGEMVLAIAACSRTTSQFAVEKDFVIRCHDVEFHSEEFGSDKRCMCVSLDCVRSVKTKVERHN